MTKIFKSILAIVLCVLQDACHELFCAFGDFYASGLLNAEVTISLFEPNLLSLYFYHYHITEEQSSTQFLFLGWQCVWWGGGGRGHRGMRQYGESFRLFIWRSKQEQNSVFRKLSLPSLFFLIDCSMPLWMFIMCRCLLLWFVLDYSSVLCFHPSFHFYRQMFQGYKNFSGVR